MDTIFMNSQNSETSDLLRISLNLSDRIDLNRSDKYVTLSSLIIYYTWKNTKKSCSNNKFKISKSTWDEQFELLNWSYSVSDIQNYLDYIRKNSWNSDW